MRQAQRVAKLEIGILVWPPLATSAGVFYAFVVYMSGPEIKQFRIDCGLSQRELASRLKVPRSTWQLIEDGQKSPGPELSERAEYECWRERHWREATDAALAEQKAQRDAARRVAKRAEESAVTAQEPAPLIDVDAIAEERRQAEKYHHLHGQQDGLLGHHHDQDVVQDGVQDAGEPVPGRVVPASEPPAYHQRLAADLLGGRLLQEHWDPNQESWGQYAARMRDLAAEQAPRPVRQAGLNRVWNPWLNAWVRQR